jgi:hypothetical protein
MADDAPRAGVGIQAGTGSLAPSGRLSRSTAFLVGAHPISINVPDQYG